jgi:hypothetical protein
MENGEYTFQQELEKQHTYRRFSPTSEALTFLGASATSFFMSGIMLEMGAYGGSTIAFIAGVGAGVLGTSQLKHL